MTPRVLLWFGLALTLARAGLAATPAEFRLVEDWKVEVTAREPRALKATIRVTPPVSITVMAERYQTLPRFDSKAAGWIKGAQLRGVQTQECTTPH